MTEHQTEAVTLRGVPETLLIPLYFRAIESMRSDALIRDERAVELVNRISYDFGQVRKIRMSEGNKVARIMLTREMDRYAWDFLSRHPDSVVVHIGCGLDSRFERVDNGRVEWYDLDLPDVIELRRRLIGGEGGRYHLLGCSVLEDDWLEAVKVHSRRPFLFLADNVLVFFTEAQAKRLVQTLRKNFPGSELVFDAWAPFFVWLANLQLSSSKFGGLLQWGLWSSQTLESWDEGIHMLGQWGFFDQPEPRMDPFRWIAPIFNLFKPMRILHFQLGEAAA